MSNYILAVGACIVLVIIASMGAVHYVEVFYSTEAAATSLYVAAPCAAFLIGLILVMFEDLRIRLTLQSRAERGFHG
ncbi:MAG: hypothetical protein JWL87_633 [Candidatus Adlerbacteria bacterium]|nr:hypothetical protein [Candidatus Adlerbacteria bacterium]